MKVPENEARRCLLAAKHVDFIANYGKTNNEYVSHSVVSRCAVMLNRPLIGRNTA